MNRNINQDLYVLATEFYSRLNENSTWQNPFDYQNWKPEIIIRLLGELPAGEFSELHQDSLTDEQRQYSYSLYKGLPDYLRNQWSQCELYCMNVSGESF